MPAQKYFIIMAGTENTELEKAIIDLENAVKLQELMKSANAVIRKNKNVTAELIKLGIPQFQAQQLQQPDFANRIGFPTYKLTNNNATIKRLQDKVNMLKKKQVASEKAVETGGQTYAFDGHGGGTIVVNYDEDRVQILFPGGRVEKELYTTLRKSGWVYSPTNKAFQRKLTPQAISAAISMFSAKRVETDLPNKAAEAVAPPLLDYNEMLDSRNFSYVSGNIYNAINRYYKGDNTFHLVYFDLIEADIKEKVKDYFKQHLPELEADKITVNVYPKNYITKSKKLFDAGAYLPSSVPPKILLGALYTGIKEFFAKEHKQQPQQSDLFSQEPIVVEEPNTPDEFDQAVMDNIVPQENWVGNIVKEGNIRRQILEQLSGPEEDKLMEAQRILLKYKEQMQKGIEVQEDKLAETKNIPPISEDGLYQIYIQKVKQPDGTIKEYFGVPSIKNKESKGFGDGLHETLEAATKEVERNRLLEVKEIEASERLKKEQADKADSDLDRKEANKGKTAIQIAQEARDNKTLDAKISYNGVVNTRKWHTKNIIDNGGRVETAQVPAIKDLTRSAFNRMDGRQQQDFERRQKAAGNKTEYRLFTKDGSFYTITKAEYDYATTLQPEPELDIADKSIDYSGVSTQELRDMHEKTNDFSEMAAITKELNSRVDTKAKYIAWKQREIWDGNNDMVVRQAADRFPDESIVNYQDIVNATNAILKSGRESDKKVANGWAEQLVFSVQWMDPEFKDWKNYSKEEKERLLQDYKDFGIKIPEHIKLSVTRAPKYAVGDSVRYTAGDIDIETWYGEITKIVDLDTEYAYRINAYHRYKDGKIGFDSEKTNEKYEAQLTPTRGEMFIVLKSEYNKQQTLNKFKEGDSVEMINTLKEPTMRHFNKAIVLGYSGQFVRIKVLQDNSEILADEDNLRLIAPDAETTREEFFELPHATTVDELDNNINHILSQYSHRKMAAVQVLEYLSESEQLGKEWMKSKNIVTKVELDNYLSAKQSKLRSGKGKEHKQAKVDNFISKITDMAETANAEMEAQIAKQDIDQLDFSHLSDPIKYPTDTLIRYKVMLSMAGANAVFPNKEQAQEAINAELKRREAVVQIEPELDAEPVSENSNSLVDEIPDEDFEEMTDAYDDHKDDDEIMAKYPRLTKQQVRNIYEQVSAILASGKDIVSEKERYILEQYEGLGSQTQTGIVDKGLLHQFYTPYIIAKKSYQLAEYYGFKGGVIVEPSMGTGRFFKFAPEGSTCIGFDPDEKNIQIAKLLYPDATIYKQEFETAFLESPRYNRKASKSWVPQADLVIGNPPYGDYLGYYKSYMPKEFKRFEFLFVYLGLKLLRKDGLLIYIVSQNFMNNGAMYNGMKTKILEIGTFVDSIRLPNGIFSSTDVGTDIIIFRKK